MNSPVLDLSQFAPKPPEPAGASSYVIDVDEATFSQLANHSMKYPVVLEVTMPSEPQTHAVSQTLKELANQGAGRWLLARVDVSKYPTIAQALGVQAVPTVIALIGGQVAPLFQGTADRDHIVAVIDEVLKIAVQNGIAGRVTPQPSTEEQGEDPRFAEADQAMEANDFEKAVEEFDKLIKKNPKDAEAIAGRAQARLLLRTKDVDPQVIEKADSDPSNAELQLAASDYDLLTGDFEKAFNRLITFMADNPTEKDAVKERLLDIFNTVDPANPALLNARRRLSTVLF